MTQERNPNPSEQANPSQNARNRRDGAWADAHEVPVSTTAANWSRPSSSPEFTPRRMRRAQHEAGPATAENPQVPRPKGPETATTQGIPPRVRHGERKRERIRNEEAQANSSTPASSAANGSAARDEKIFLPVASGHEDGHGAYPLRRAEKRGKRGRAEQSEKSVQQTRKKKKRRPARILTVLIIVALVIGIGLFAFKAIGGTSLFTGPENYPGPGQGTVDVTIPEGATGGEIAEILVKKDVVASVAAFTTAFKENPLAKGIQPGMYELKHKMSAKEALNALLNSNNRIEKKVTLVEGRRLETFLAQLVEQKVFTKADIDQAVADPAALGLPAVANGKLEGWFAPATYVIKPDTTAAILFKEMIATTKQRLEALNVPEAQWETMLIKASIVEKEVNKPEYYGKVARVIDNRLKEPNETAGFLGMDSTVNYGVGKDGGTPTKADLEKDTPYNSRLHKGLPPTPIGAVGEKALAAAANPTPGPWLYFVTVNLDTGETLFSSTKAEFDQQAAQLREFCNTHKGKC